MTIRAIVAAARHIPISRDPAIILIDQLKTIHIAGKLDPIDTAVWFPKLLRKDYVVGLKPGAMSRASRSWSTATTTAGAWRTSGSTNDGRTDECDPFAIPGRLLGSPRSNASRSLGAAEGQKPGPFAAPTTREEFR